MVGEGLRLGIGLLLARSDDLEQIAPLRTILDADTTEQRKDPEMDQWCFGKRRCGRSPLVAFSPEQRKAG